MAKQVTIDNEEQQEPSLSIPELSDKSAELWVAIAEEKDKKKKVALILDYNIVAEELNKKAGREMIVLLTVKSKVDINPQAPAKRHAKQSQQNYEIQQRTNDEPLEQGVDEASTKAARREVLKHVKAEEKKAPAKGGKGKQAAAPAIKVTTKQVTKKEGGPGIIDQIIALHVKGLSNKEIVDKGFNKSTVNRQVGEYKKRKANGK